MLKRFSLFAAMLLMAGNTFAAAPTGKPAPAFTGLDTLSGKSVSLADFKGKTVVLEWNNFGCPFVQKHYSTGAMQVLQERSIADGVVWVVVNSSGKDKQGYLADKAAVTERLEHFGSAPSYYLLDHDGTIGRAYGATTTPNMFVIDAKGTLVYAGAIDDNSSADSADLASTHNYVKAALKALADGTPVKLANTQPYGCNIKYAY